MTIFFNVGLLQVLVLCVFMTLGHTVGSDLVSQDSLMYLKGDLKIIQRY